jgi:methyl-accepting chemotaxis protein
MFQRLWNYILGLKFPLSVKVIIMIAFLEAGAIITLAVFVILYNYRVLLDDADSRAEEIAVALRRPVIESIIHNDYIKLQKTIELLAREESIRYAIIQDKHGRALVHSHPHYVGLIFNDPNSLKAFYSDGPIVQDYYAFDRVYTRDLSIPLDTAMGRIGFIRIGMNFDTQVRRPLMFTAIAAVVMVFVFTGIGILIAIPATRLLLEPVHSVQRATEAIAVGDLTVRVDSVSRDEIGSMAQAFNRMIESHRSMVSSIRRISSDVSQAAEELAASAEQVSSSAIEVNNTIQKVADDSVTGMQHTTDINRMIESFTDLLNQARDQAGKTMKVAAETYSAADQGRQDVIVMNETMFQIKTGSEENLEAILKLDEFTRQIEGITDAISGIAGQINLLALNAAIEAARAGDVGRGFAVVADEIGKLADQSTRQAKDVAGMVNRIIEITRSSVGVTKKQSELILQGAEAASAVNESLGRIVEASRAISTQAQRILEIAEKEVQESELVRSRINALNALMSDTANRAVEVRQATRETTGAMEEVARGSQTLSSLAVNLKEMMDQFKLGNDDG